MQCVGRNFIFFVLTAILLNNFKILVGNLAVPATSVVQSDYEVCAHHCTAQSASRRYYTCERPIEGNHVAVVMNGALFLCEVEIYADTSGKFDL